MSVRAEIARAAAQRLEKSPPGTGAFVGFDGFVDSIVRIVDVRRSMAVPDYEPIRTIPAFAARCAAAAGRSANLERVLIEDRFGGNGPLLAGALAALGSRVTYVGAVGDGSVDAVFRPFAARCAACHAIGAPSHTLCMEFDDGKVMFNDTARVQDVTWTRVIERVGLEGVRDAVRTSSLIGVVNWSLLGGVESIWEGLRTQVFPELDGRERRIFIDLSDPAKRLDADVRRAMTLIRGLEETPGISVTLGLNLSEAQRVGRVLGVLGEGQNGVRAPLDGLEGLASSIRTSVGVDTVVVHPREGAAAANSAGATWFVGPFTNTPALSTGAGDHFNAGFAYAQVQGLDLAQCLATGCAVSGAYVRDAASPNIRRVVEFLRTLPEPDRG